jgi:plastocyanin
VSAASSSDRPKRSTSRFDRPSEADAPGCYNFCLAKVPVEEDMLLRPSSFVMAAGLAVAAGCGSGGGGGTANQVTIADFTFTPSMLTVKAGSAVTWTNRGPSAHTVTSDTMVFESMNLSAPVAGDPYGGGGMAAGTFQFTFNTPGTYAYHCSLHPPTMPAYSGFTGTIVVTQ